MGRKRKDSSLADKVAADKAKKEREATDSSKAAIIEYIRSEKMFYDSKHPSYKTSKVRKIAQLKEHCGDQLEPKMTGEQVLETWNGLRRQYRTYLIKYKSCKSGDAGMIKKKWKFFESLRWLDDYLEPIEEISSVRQPHLKPTSSSDCPHQFENLDEDDPWVTQCALCHVFQCAHCKHFCSFENESSGKMREHTMKCFGEGTPPLTDHLTSTSTVDPDRYCPIVEDDAVRSSLADQVIAEDDAGNQFVCQVNVFQSPKKKKPKQDNEPRSNSKNEKKEVMQSLMTCLSAITSNCSANQSASPHTIDSRSPNSMYCNGLRWKLDRIYDQQMHGVREHARFEALEEIKFQIDQLVYKAIKELNKPE